MMAMRWSGLAALVLIGIAVTAGGQGLLPNVADPEDLNTLVSEMHVDLIQVRATEDPTSPLLYEIQAVFIPRLSGDANPAVFRDGPVLFIAIWSPETGDEFGFFAFEENAVVAGSAPGFTQSFEATSRQFTHVSDGGEINLFIDEDTGDVGLILPFDSAQYALDTSELSRSENPLAVVNGELAEGVVPFALSLENYRVARSDGTEATTGVGTTWDGDMGTALQYILSQVDLEPILEESASWVYSTPYGSEPISSAVEAVDTDLPLEALTSSAKTSGAVTIIVPIPPSSPTTMPCYSFAYLGQGIIPGVGQVNNGAVVSAVPSGNGFNLVVVKDFTWSNGTFQIELSVYLDSTTHYTSGTWKVVAGSGTGAYIGASGSGSINGTPFGGQPSSVWVGITDTYTGTFSIP